jgi:hypothetical protein
MKHRTRNQGRLVSSNGKEISESMRLPRKADIYQMFNKEQQIILLSKVSPLNLEDLSVILSP